MPLINPTEVVRFSPVDRNYPVSTLCDLILQVEESWFHECLGDDMYDYLISVLTEKPEDIQEWSAQQSYAEDDIVQNNLCLFISSAGCNSTKPGEVGSLWNPLPKFTDSCSNTLWTKYLARILALKVYSKSLLFTTFKSSSAGLSVNEVNNSGIRAANSKEILMTRDELLDQIEETVQNMTRWLRKQVKEGNCNFPKSIPGLECGAECETPNSSGRRFFLPNRRKITEWGY